VSFSQEKLLSAQAMNKPPQIPSKPQMATPQMAEPQVVAQTEEPATSEDNSDGFEDDIDKIAQLHRAAQELRKQIHKRVIGQDDVIDLLLMALFSRGHGLFVGVPGLAKTLLIQTISESLGLRFNRIQFTPDMMPSDITGTDVLEEDRQTGQRNFRFIHGPVFANIILADEINRTPPKTQAALLQAMQENQVTAGGKTHTLPPPFLVFATQNPIEQEGTYPLPEAQLDRFMCMIDVGYPSTEEEVAIVQSTTGGDFPPLRPILEQSKIMAFQDLVRRVPVAEHVVKYAVSLVRATRPDEDAPEIVKENVRWGAGPRASQNLILGAKAKAALEGRATAHIDDVKGIAIPVLMHRLVVSFGARSSGIAAPQIIRELIADPNKRK
jgi:MoxR-like ATPase